jgi:hypothetical protein
MTAPTVFLSPWFNEESDLNGIPNNGGSVTVYLTGTTTPASVYTDHTGTVANTNPIALNSQGYPVNPIWLDISHAYDAIVKDSLGNTVFQLNYIAVQPQAVTTVTPLGVWVDTAVVPTISSGTQFTLAGKWDVTLSSGRRLKVTLNSDTTEFFGAVRSAIYSVGTNTTLVTMVCDSTGAIYASGGVDKVYYSCLDSVNLAVPYVSYCGANVGTPDAIVVYLPTVVAINHNTRITVRNNWTSGAYPTNTTLTPTINVNATGVLPIYSMYSRPVRINSIGEYSDFIYDANIGAWVLINEDYTTEQQRWEIMPIGLPVPFFPTLIGTDVNTWLTNHPKWRRLSNSYVTGIEGGVIGVSLVDAYNANTIYGSNAGSLPLHTHTGSVTAHNHSGSSIGSHTHPVNDSGHAHSLPNSCVASGVNSFAGVFSAGVWLGGGNTSNTTTGITIGASSSASLNIAMDTPTLTINSAGVSVTDQNMQKTYMLDWVYKYV